MSADKFKCGRSDRNITVTNLAPGVFDAASLATTKTVPVEDLKIGIIGLSVHSAAFTEIINDNDKSADLKGCWVAALFHPAGNPDVEFSVEQLKSFEEAVKKMGVKIAGSMNELLQTVDVVMLLTNDGRPHQEQILPVLKAGKPVFIDKPVGASLKDVVRIFNHARKYNTPVFSSSALRYLQSAQNIERTEVLGAQTFSPAPLQAAHTELFWDGIHGVELLYAIMGEGCKEVMQAHHTEGEDMVVGFWENGRVGVFKGIRHGKADFGGIVFGKQSNTVLGSFDGYRPLVVKIGEFFVNRQSPVQIKETLEIYAFMEAAQESRKRGGIKVSLNETLKKHS